jgi:hypothetical protein
MLRGVGLVAPADVEAQVDFEDTADIALLDEAEVVLGVNNSDARGSHNGVVNVPPCTRDCPVV